MSNHSYDVETYNTTLQTELNKLWGIGVLLLIVLIAIVVYSIFLIREDKTKKLPYFQLIGVIVVSVLLITSFTSSIINYSKDISNEAYIQYEGSAEIVKKRKVVLGNIPTWYDEYVISFYNNGKLVELSTRKDYAAEKKIENLYIVYAKNSGEILEFVE